jgi:hypothetical protein
MKKRLCILLMCWLPIFMLSANAMSLQMTLQQLKTEHQSMHSMACHQDKSNQSESAQTCLGCGFCVVATSIASFNNAPTFYLENGVSTAPLMIDVIYQSYNLLPADRPPILS